MSNSPWSEELCSWHRTHLFSKFNYQSIMYEHLMTFSNRFSIHQRFFFNQNSIGLIKILKFQRRDINKVFYENSYNYIYPSSFTNPSKSTNNKSISIIKIPFWKALVNPKSNCQLSPVICILYIYRIIQGSLTLLYNLANYESFYIGKVGSRILGKGNVSFSRFIRH